MQDAARWMPSKLSECRVILCTNFCEMHQFDHWVLDDWYQLGCYSRRRPNMELPMTSSPRSPGWRRPAFSKVLATVLTVLCAVAASRSRAAAPVLPLDPEVVAALAEISPARIDSRIRTLVGFGTRHTLSDTLSDTRGVGAARRWIERVLKACSAAAGGRLQVRMDEYPLAKSERVPNATTLVNVVATLPGTDAVAGQRMLVVSGHYDSRAGDVMNPTIDAPGANDDASGTAAVMEMACVMAPRRFPVTIVFMTVAGEEQGLLGAEQFAIQAKKNGWRIDAMITNDIIGSPVGDAGQRDGKQVRLFADGLTPLLNTALSTPAAAGSAPRPVDAPDAAAIEAVRQALVNQVRAGGVADFGPNQLGRHLKAVGERYVAGFHVNLIQRPDRYLRGGDHAPFLARGYAAVRFTEPFENFDHQHQDVRMEGAKQIGDLPEFVDPAYVADVVRVNLAGLATLALAPAAPANAKLETLQLTNDTTLRWDAVTEPGVTGYRIVWRETGLQAWQHFRDVGNVTHFTLSGVSKDNLIFGVQTLGAGGHASLAAFPLPLRR